MGKHWNRLKRSLGRRWREWRLPWGYERLGTRYGGWWLNARTIGPSPLLIDCGLGMDISFPAAFLKRFPGARVIGIDPNPKSLEYCRARCPEGMTILDRAFWTTSGEAVTFHLPRPPDQLPKGADGVSGSLDASHEYVAGGDRIETLTIDLSHVLKMSGRDSCDVLKLDVEGAEYGLLEALAESGTIGRARQLLVEFHHGVTDRALADTQRVLSLLARSGFRLVHTEGRNYVFHGDRTR